MSKRFISVISFDYMGNASVNVKCVEVDTEGAVVQELHNFEIDSEGFNSNMIEFTIHSQHNTQEEWREMILRNAEKFKLSEHVVNDMFNRMQSII